MPEDTLTLKQLKLKKLEQQILSSLERFKQLSDEKSIHKRNMLFAIKQYLKDGNQAQLEAGMRENPRWDESSNPFGSRVRALVEETAKLHQDIQAITGIKPDSVQQGPKNNNAKIIRPKPIERIVCSGGGAKGVVYPGSYKAMMDTGVYDSAKEFSGASAGAITAAMMAVGMSTDSFREQLLTTNFKDLMGKTVKEKGPGIGAVGGRIITKTGAPLLDFIKSNLNNSIKKTIAQLENSSELPPNEKLHNLFSKIKNTSEQELSITFGDLALLNHYFPQHFKQLTIPAVRYPTGELQIFNSELTPNVEIALACRASASLPVILKPQAITINGEEQLFVDGGLYDNLPTDYFDREASGFVKNKKPDQTLVFAFGEGLNNNKNQVFQALYGQRLDETIATHVVENIIDSAIQQIKAKPKNAKEEVALFKAAIDAVLMKQVEQKYLSVREADFVKSAMIKTVEKLLLTPQQNPKFWKEYKTEENYKQKITLLSATIKEQMKPILYKAGIIEHLKRDVLVSELGGLNTPYTNTAQKELGYQKLRSDYPLRTVELRVGTLKTTSFDPATRLARVMDALGYLDTVNHISNHELHNPEKFNVEEFFGDVTTNFEAIYKAVLLGSGKNPAKDSLLLEIHSLHFQLKLQGKPTEVINRQIYQLIKDQVEKGLDSAEAFALSRAVEYSNKTLSSENLFKETYEEGFKRAGLFAVSNITGQRIMSTSSLHKALADKSVNMFELYDKRESSNKQNRTEQVFTALSELTAFTEDYDAHKGESNAPVMR